ncbi:hypothetical protein BDDG_12950 [Blastomyces dermatitidis ATCC 18188]|uniref:Choline monooxygenase, chloroplastic n=1 Tax=Ajellomyces dermatitidis (strain ATCC 18188 / CBS 674.68) TaxID=653446 RepID=A0A0J9HHP5_AJEDA|nr:hypothetical protein BDDG_12950 [Blastomyces dermatitidis ATCC 18188]
MAEFQRTLPASWYRSLPLYQLERRAVFLKAWYLLGPVTRFHEVDTKVQYEIAQERLYVERKFGSSALPTAEELKVIHESTGAELPSHLTPTGLLFAGISQDAPDFHEFYPDLEPLLARVDFTRLPYRHSVKYEGNFNWKTMVDGYQECLHCQYTHPSFSIYYPPTFYTVYNHLNFSQHVADPKKPDDGLFLYFFPNCTLNVYGGGMSSFRVCPTRDPNVTRMEFDYYHLELGDKFEKYFKFVRQVAMEDYELCERAQENLQKGVYNEGILNPVKETGVAYYQNRVFDLVTEQHRHEKSTEGPEKAVGDGISHPAQAAAVPSSLYELSRMEYLSSFLSNTFVLASVPIILLAILAVTQKDGKVFRRPLLPRPGALPLDTLSSNVQSKLAWIEDLFLRRVASTIATRKGSDGLTTAADQPPSANVCKESDFPDNWWTGDEVFRLERRAIFSKTWLYIAHASRFTKPGDYHAFEICGFPLFLIQGKDSVIRAFHNVCRHRAYPVISKKKSGSSTVMGCRYHGWTYDSKGQLIKAPQFECLEGFDKTQNSLFEIRTAISKHGLIFVNLDARGDPPELQFDARRIDRFASVNRIPRRSVWIDGWELEGRFNWKMAVRNLYEDKGVAGGTKPELSNLRSVLQSIFGVDRASDPKSSTLEAFPTTSIYATGKESVWYSISVAPIEANRSYIRCDMYGSAVGKQADGSQGIPDGIKSSLEARIAKFEATYKSFSTPGRTNPDDDSTLNEDAVDCTHDRTVQEMILLKLKSHLKLERVAGEEILPTVRGSSTSDRYKLANELCKELENLEGSISSSPACQMMVKDSLAW